MDALNSTLVLALIAILVDSIRGLVTKSPPYLIAPFVRLWRETAYLRNILHDKRFAQWRPKTARYVALRAIKAQSGQKMTRPVLDLLQESLKRDEPVVLLGEPGAGKTTALEALTYRMARRAYRWNILLWFALLSIAALLSRLMPSLAFLWLTSFLLWEALARCATVPIFLEARSDYTGGEVKGWIEKVLKTHLGAKPFLGSYRRAVLLVDGVNEVQAGLYGTFVEGWRSLLQEHRRAVLTSRTGEDPSGRLGVSTVLTICDLDDEGVREFLQVYGREKARVENRRYTDEDVHRDFEELRNKNLLGERGIGRNPYWLKMVVESGLYTRNRGALFRQFAERLIRREIEEKPEERKRRPEWKIVPLEVEMDALGRLALAMQREQRIGYSGEKGWEMAREAIRDALDDPSYRPEDVLGEAEAATLVRTKYKERVEFVHQLVQEFFAAWALRNRWREALNHVEDVWWWETIFLLGGLVGADEYPGLVAQTMSDGRTPRLFAAIGLLGSVDEPPPEVSELVIARLAASVGDRLTEEQERAVLELGRILGEDEAAVWFSTLFRSPDRRKKKTGAMLLCAVGGRRATETLLDALRDPWEREPTVDILTSIGAPAVELLVAALGDQDENVRWCAALVLGAIGDARAVEPLIAALDNPKGWVRWRAAGALGEIGDPRAVGPLIAALNDQNEDVRWRAAEALGKIGDRRALEPLIAILTGPDAVMRRSAALALGAIGDARSVEWLVDALLDQDEVLRRNAAEALGRIGDARAVEPLIDALDDPDASVRRSAAESLGKINDTCAAEPLIDALGDPDASVRRSVVEALGRIGDARAVEPLIAVLRDQYEEISQSAAEALVGIGASAVEPLIDALSDPDRRVRQGAAEALVSIGASAVKPLIAALYNRNEDLRRRVGKVLVKIGAPAVELLIDALSDHDIWMRRRVAEMLGAIGDARAIEPLIDALCDPDEGVRLRAAEALTNIGASAVEPLIVALRSQYNDVRWRSAEALGRIGDARAVEPLIAALNDRNERVRRSAAEALGRVGDTRAVKSLIDALSDRDEIVRGSAASALGRVGDARAVESLVAALNDPNGGVRRRAADALGRIGDARALPELERVVREDKDIFVADAARNAIARIRQRANKG